MSVAAKTDVLAMARAVVSDPRKGFTIPMLGLAAVCQALVDSVDNPQAILPTELADAAHALIAAEAAHSHAKGPDGYAPLKIGLVREQAFLTFKSLFEQEFPND